MKQEIQTHRNFQNNNQTDITKSLKNKIQHSDKIMESHKLKYTQSPDILKRNDSSKSKMLLEVKKSNQEVLNSSRYYKLDQNANQPFKENINSNKTINKMDFDKLNKEYADLKLQFQRELSHKDKLIDQLVTNGDGKKDSKIDTILNTNQEYLTLLEKYKIVKDKQFNLKDTHKSLKKSQNDLASNNTSKVNKSDKSDESKMIIKELQKENEILESANKSNYKIIENQKLEIQKLKDLQKHNYGSSETYRSNYDSVNIEHQKLQQRQNSLDENMTQLKSENEKQLTKITELNYQINHSSNIKQDDQLKIMKSKIDELRNQNEEIQSEKALLISGFNEEINQLKSELYEKELINEKTNNIISDCEKQISILNLQVGQSSNLETELNFMKELNIDLNSRLTSCKQQSQIQQYSSTQHDQINKLKLKINQLESEIDTINYKHNIILSDTNQRHTKVSEDLNKDISSKILTIEKLQKDNEKLFNEQSEIDTDQNQLSAQHQELIKKYQDYLNSTVSKEGSKMEKIVQLEQQICKEQQSLSDQKIEITQLNKDLDKKLSIIDKMKKDYKDLDLKLKGKIIEMDEIKNEKDEIIKTNQELNAEVDVNKGQIEDLNNTIIDLKNVSNQYEKDKVIMEDMRLEINKMKEDNQNDQNQINKLKTEKEEIEVKLKVLYQNQQDLTKENNSLQEKVKESKTTNKKLNEQIKHIDLLNEENEKLKRQVKELNTSNKNISAEKDQLNEEVKALKTKYLENSNDAKSLNSKLDESEKSIANLKIEIANFKNEIEKLQNNNKKKQELIDHLNTRSESNKKLLSQQKIEITQLKKDIESSNNKNLNKNDNNSDEISQLKKDLNIKQENLDKLQSTLNEYEKSEASKKEEISDMKFTITKLNDHIKILEMNNSDLEFEITQVKEEMQTKELQFNINNENSSQNDTINENQNNLVKKNQELNDEVLRLKLELNDYEIVSSTQNNGAESDLLKEQLNNSNNELEEIKIKYEKLLKEEKNNLDSGKNLISLNKSQEKKIADLESILSKNDIDKEKVTNEIEELKHQCKTLKDKIKELEDSNKALISDKEKLQSEYKIQEKLMESLKVNNKKLADQLMDM